MLNTVKATEVKQVETKGTIGFTGVYEPIGTPDPPPESIKKPPMNEGAKPGGTLPQTNELEYSSLTWLGVFLSSIVLLLLKRQIHKNNYNNKKVGIIT